MQLNYAGLSHPQFWHSCGISLPSYPVKEVARRTQSAPQWAHFGIGNIFRIFIGGIADTLLEQGWMDRGLTCVEVFDPGIVEAIYAPHDNLALNILLHKDGKRDMRVCGAFSEVILATPQQSSDIARLRDVFTCPDLQMVSFTITEKGYALTDVEGAYLPAVAKDLVQGPDAPSTVIPLLTSMLYSRYCAGALPLALVSMDNCAHNGDLLKNAVLSVAHEWEQRGWIESGFLGYLQDPARITFPWTMIDKITPRPSETWQHTLEEYGLENIGTVVTDKRTYIAPFANAEVPQYLVIEDDFPAGRPPLEKGYGVYMTDRRTVNLCERMKVTACLNPVHSALGPIGVVLGIDGFADLLEDPDLLSMAQRVAYTEGMPMIENPGILSPKAFTDELFQERFPNRYLGDTNLRLCTDVTQGWSVRFGQTIHAYVAHFGSAASLTAIPLGIAGCFRYMMGTDDQGMPYPLAPDPLAEQLHEALSSLSLGNPDSLRDQLRPYLSNSQLFGIDLYTAGVGSKIEDMLRSMLEGPGACRSTVHRWMHR